MSGSSCGGGCWVGGAGVAAGCCSSGARLEDADERKMIYACIKKISILGFMYCT